MNPSGSSVNPRRLNVLTFDGGGARGFSSLLILQRLMQQINSSIDVERGIDKGAAREPHHAVQPHEIFGLVASTNTGGLIAIMLGKLGMSVEQCIRAYHGLSARIYSRAHIRGKIKGGPGPTRSSGSRLQECIRDLVTSQDINADLPMISSDNSDRIACTVICRESVPGSAIRRGAVFMCNHLPCPNSPECLVWEAARATSAAPTYFPPQRINDRWFVDGGPEYNNPSFEIFAHYTESIRVACSKRPSDAPGPAVAHSNLDFSNVRFVNIGTGNNVPRRRWGHLSKRIPGPIRQGLFLKTTLTDFAVETERTANYMKVLAEVALGSINLTWERFNADNGLCYIKPDQYKRLPQIEVLTRQYLETPTAQENLRRVGREIAREYLGRHQSKTMNATTAKESEEKGKAPIILGSLSDQTYTSRTATSENDIDLGRHQSKTMNATTVKPIMLHPSSAETCNSWTATSENDIDASPSTRSSRTSVSIYSRDSNTTIHKQVEPSIHSKRLLPSGLGPFPATPHSLSQSRPIKIRGPSESMRRPASSDELLPDQAQALRSDPVSWKNIVELLPEYLKSCLDYNSSTAGHCCWTCTPQFLDSNEKIPLYIAGVSVVIPIAHIWPVSAGVAPPPDPYPIQLDPTAPIQFQVVLEILNTFEECLGFYLLINGYLQLIVPDSFDKSWAQSHLPNTFGGLQVSYITMQNLFPTAEGEIAEGGSPSSSRRGLRRLSSLFRSSRSSSGSQSTPPSSVSRPSSVTSPTSKISLNAFVEARKKVFLRERHERYTGRIGLCTQVGSSTYFVMSTHVITNAMGWKQKGKSNSGSHNWRESANLVDIVSGGIKLGKICKFFDDNVDEFPVSFNHDITLIEPSQTVNVDEVLSPIHNLGWSSLRAWDNARSRPTIVKYLGMDPKDINGECLSTAKKGLIIGEGIFRTQRSRPLPRKLELSQLEEHELWRWRNVVSRCILYRVSGNIDSRTGYSGTALYMDDCELESGSRGPGVIGFQSFAHGSGYITNLEFLSESRLDTHLKYGMVSFHGAFQVPEEMRKGHKIMNTPKVIVKPPNQLELVLGEG